jgi:hypothetical protein
MNILKIHCPNKILPIVGIDINQNIMANQTKRIRCKVCGNMYRTKSDISNKTCSVCAGTNTTPNGNRITGYKI